MPTRSFLLGPGFVIGVGNGLILGYLMYRAGLVPRGMAMLGLIGGPLVCASGIAVMFGAFEAGSAWQFLATIPEIAWEASLGIYLIATGFKASSPILHGNPATPQPNPARRSPDDNRVGPAPRSSAGLTITGSAHSFDLACALPL